MCIRDSADTIRLYMNAVLNIIPDRITIVCLQMCIRDRYGRMRRAFLQENNTLLYNHLILNEKLYPHLWEIQETATARMEQMMADLLKANPAPDKKLNQMAWVQHMNMLKAQAEEVILTELINS